MKLPENTPRIGSRWLSKDRGYEVSVVGFAADVEGPDDDARFVVLRRAGNGPMEVVEFDKLRVLFRLVVEVGSAWLKKSDTRVRVEVVEPPAGGAAALFEVGSEWIRSDVRRAVETFVYLKVLSEPEPRANPYTVADLSTFDVHFVPDVVGADLRATIDPATLKTR